MPEPVPVLLATAAVVAAELVVQRLLVRIALHIPALPFLRGPYSIVTGAGSIIFLAAVIMTLLALTTALWTLARQLPRSLGASLMTAVLPLPILGSYVGVRSFQAGWELPLVLLYLLALAALGTVILTVSRLPSQRLFAATAVLSLAVGAITGAEIVAAARFSVTLRLGGEAGALATAILAPLAFRSTSGVSRRILIAALAVGIAVLLMPIGNRATANILLLWGLGLTGALPIYLYGAAAAALAYAILRQVVAGRVYAALALAFLAMGGYGLHNTYQSDVQILGLCTLLLAVLDRQPVSATVG